ncbi:MAG: RDD family protein [Actinomycetota bacterium]
MDGAVYAEWWQRLVALLIDGVIVAVPSWIIMILSGLTFALSSRIDVHTGRAIGSAGLFYGPFAFILAAGILYRVLMEGGARGQTVGTMIMKIRVRDVDTDASIGYGRAFVRWLVFSLLCFVWIGGLVDALFPLWDQRKQTIHDKAARSIVVKVP